MVLASRPNLCPEFGMGLRDMAPHAPGIAAARYGRKEVSITLLIGMAFYLPPHLGLGWSRCVRAARDALLEYGLNSRSTPVLSVSP